MRASKMIRLAVAVLAVCLPGMLLHADSLRMHPLEKYCVTRQSQGMMEGETIECSCEWGRMRYEIQDVSMKVGSMTMPNRQHLIQIGSEITTFNPDTRYGTVTRIPNFMALLEGAETAEGMSNMRRVMESTGSTFTEETKEVAGEECQIVLNPGIGDMCLSGDGIIMEFIVAGGTMTQVATNIDKTTCGDMANYQVPPDVVLGDAPNPGSIMEQLEQMWQESQQQ